MTKKAASEVEPTGISKKRRYSRQVLHKRRVKKLMKSPHERVAIRPGRCSNFFKLQTSALNNNTLKCKKIYTAELGQVTRIGGHANVLLAQMIEKNLSEICKKLKRHSVHANRTTVKASDFKLYLSQLR